jgi:hypothetical protein
LKVSFHKKDVTSCSVLVYFPQGFLGSGPFGGGGDGFLSPGFWVGTRITPFQLHAYDYRIPDVVQKETSQADFLMT